MRLKTIAAAALCAGLPIQASMAKVAAEKAAELGGSKYTCLGAEKAGSASGIPEYTGKYFGTWPGQSKPFGYEPGPYASEKPSFTITAANMAQYADKLTEGQKALLKKYPKTYRMNIYPSHRDFRFDDWVCDVTKTNATTAEIVHDGYGINGTTGSIPFPFPSSGLEAVWNLINPPRTWTEEVVYDIAGVYPNGSVAWGKMKFRTLNLGLDPKKRGSFQSKENINAYFYTSFLKPERDKGFTAVGFQPDDFKNASTQSWQYLPGIRRVRQAPEVGFDYPVPPNGLRTVDDDYGFNGSPERYTWKLVGKKELYVPYHNFKINDPALKYKDLLTPDTINPEYLRYELHRVWVVEGTLKQGVRHVYSKRILYGDEDSWLTLSADNYDGRGQLWRTNIVSYFYSQEAKRFHRSATVYHDLASGAYEATYLTNEAGANWWRLNKPMTAAEFSPDAAARGGH
jgi:hypothetical protein